MLVGLLEFYMVFSWTRDCILDWMRAVHFIPTLKFEKAENQQRPKPMALYIKEPRYSITTCSKQVDVDYDR